MIVAKAEFKSQEVVNTLTFSTFQTVKNEDVPAILREMADMFDKQLADDKQKATEITDTVYEAK
jgi:hypothetical protein